MPEGAFPSLEIGGRVAFWTSPEGMWVGSSSGQALNITENKLVFPEGYTNGATVLRDDGFIITAII